MENTVATSAGQYTVLQQGHRKRDELARIELIVAVDKAITGCDYEAMARLIVECESMGQTQRMIERLKEALR